MSRGDTSVTDYWFDELGSAGWFKKNPEVDVEIGNRFRQIHTDASRGLLSHWMDYSMGALALVIILDQFSRIICRGEPRAYSNDARAIGHAKRAVKLGYDKHVGPQNRLFFYTPFQHSEFPEDQERSVELFKKHGDKDFLNYAIWHKMIIDRFGRFPHRNPILGRHSTDEELKFMDEGGGL